MPYSKPYREWPEWAKEKDRERGRRRWEKIRGDPELLEKERARKREAARKNGRLVRYGVSEEQYAEMVRRCGNKCQICGRPPKKRSLAVDHCHKSGRVRGLLCSGCNRMLGLADDDANRLRAAINYLEQ